jgi:hypothetical protein
VRCGGSSDVRAGEFGCVHLCQSMRQFTRAPVREGRPCCGLALREDFATADATIKERANGLRSVIVDAPERPVQTAAFEMETTSFGRCR